MSSNPPPARVARVITRLNIGGPSIQATRLTTALAAHGFESTLFHGRLGAGEGDMSYLLPAGRRRALRRHVVPAAVAARRSAHAGPPVSRLPGAQAGDRAHAHGKGGHARPRRRRCLQPDARLGAARAGRAHLPRPRARGLFQRVRDGGVHRHRARAGVGAAIASSRSRRRFAANCSPPIASDATSSTASFRLASIWRRLRRIDDEARIEARRSLGLAGRARRS